MFLDWNSQPETHRMRAGASRHVASGQHSSVVRVVTDPGAEFDGRPHRHPHEQWVVVTAGELTLSCGEKKHTLGAGDVLFVPGGQWHAALGVGEQGAVYLEFSAPPRLDLLPGSVLPSALEF
ncbi:cupin domain-containing protein [Streptomyces roseirectus]|uniref:Cupin domain-containing protein n=1 Tax=Streptomyces roseirectus TaxID=2768066 RepID=A0A7H0I5P8_9ACTN|nr:cupin domain-containing protein [Streptomyces roseirectus]QNP68114.1 cupin domain-containing protein [Streptomyces roseirectus]